MTYRRLVRTVLPAADPGDPDHRSPWRYLGWLAGSQRRTMAAAIALGIVWMCCQALIPAALGRAVDAGVAARDTGALLAWSAVLLGLGAAQAVAGVLRHRLAVVNWLSAAFRTVQVVTRQATRLGATLPRRLSTGEVVSVGATDVSHLGDALDVTARASGAVVAIAVVTALMLAASPPLGLIVLAGVPLILLLGAPLLRPFHRGQERRRELVGELNTRAVDIVAGLRVLRGIGGEQVFADRYRAESQRVRQAGVAAARAESMLSGAELLLPGLLVVAVTWAGARLAVSGAITPGELVSCYGYATFLVFPMATLGEAAEKLTRAHVAAARVKRILDLDPEYPDAGGTEAGEPAELVDHTSGLVVVPGRLTAVAAADPADARAIADRLGRFAGGPVGYGGVPLAQVADVRSKVLVAVNEDVLFSGRLAESLTGGRAVRDLAAAVRAADAEDVVAATGLDAPVVESGREFSGGQQQRLRLVRALAADPRVLVLVEPTSAVDAHTEARIAARLGAARRGRTTVVCSTSPLVLDQADHVAYVRDGRVVAEGVHRTLLATSPAYAATVTREE